MSSLFVSFEAPYFSTADGEVWFIRRLFCCFGVEFVCDVGAGLAQLRYCLFNDRIVFVGFSAVRDVEQFRERS